MNPIAAKAIMDTPAWTIKDLHMEPTMFKPLNQIQDLLNTLPTFKQRALFIEKFIYKRLLGSKYLNETLEKIKSLNTLYTDINSLFHETHLNFDITTKFVIKRRADSNFPYALCFITFSSGKICLLSSHALAIV